MRVLNWALDAQKTLGGKIISVILSVALIFSFSNFFYGDNAFAEEQEVESNTEVTTEPVQSEPVVTETEKKSEEPQPKTSEQESTETSQTEEATTSEEQISTQAEGDTNVNAGIEEENTSIQPMAETAVLEFNGEGEALKEALTHEGVDTIKFTDAYSSDEVISINKDVTLDLNGKAVSINSATINGGHALTIEDSSGNGSLIGANNNHAVFVNSGKLILNNGAIKSSNPRYGTVRISTNGSAEINGGLIESQKIALYVNTGSAVINGGFISAGTYGVAAVTNGSATVTGGSAFGKTAGAYIANNGSIEISGGSLTGNVRGAICSSGQLTVRGGEITGNRQGVYCQNAVLNVADRRIVNDGDSTSNSNAAVYASGSSKVQIDGGTFVANGAVNAAGVLSGYGVAIFDDSELAITGGSISAPTFGVCGNGAPVGDKKTTINISGGDIHGNVGIYHPQIEGVMNITGGAIIGEWTGIEVRAGYVTISGGTIISNSEEFSGDPNGNGATVKGAGVAVSQHVTDRATEVTINGGDITGYYAVYENVFRDSGKEPSATELIALKITDGKFTGVSGDVICSEHQNVFVTGGYFNQDLDSSDTLKNYLGFYDDNGTQEQYPSHKTDKYEGYFHVHKPVLTDEGEYQINDAQHWQGCVVDNCIEAERSDHATVDGDIIKQPTCLDEGEQELVCNICGKKHAATKSLAATGHAFGEWVTISEATTESEGLQQRVCAHDATHVETRAIPALPVNPTPDPGDNGATDPGAGAAPNPNDGTTNAGTGTGTTTTPTGVVPIIPADTPAAALADDADEVIPDEENPLAAPDQEIADDENPLAAFDHEECWVHWFMIAGIILTIIYGAVVVLRRTRNTKHIDKMEKDLIGTTDESTVTVGSAHHSHT